MKSTISCLIPLNVDVNVVDDSYGISCLVLQSTDDVMQVAVFNTSLIAVPDSPTKRCRVHKERNEKRRKWELFSINRLSWYFFVEVGSNRMQSHDQRLSLLESTSD